MASVTTPFIPMLTCMYLHREMTPNIESRNKHQRRYVDTLGLLNICQADISLILLSTWHTHLSLQMYVLASHSWRPSITLRKKQKCIINTHVHRNGVKHVAWASCRIRKIAGYACAGNAGNVFPTTAGYIVYPANTCQYPWKKDPTNLFYPDQRQSTGNFLTYLVLVSNNCHI